MLPIRLLMLRNPWHNMSMHFYCHVFFTFFFFVESLYFYPKLFSFIRKVSNFYLKGEKRKHNNNHLPYFPFIRRHFQCGQCLRGHLSVTHNYIVIYQLFSCTMISVDFSQNINHCLVLEYHIQKIQVVKCDASNQL